MTDVGGAQGPHDRRWSCAMASRQMWGLRKRPTTDVGVARRSHQGRGDCWRLCKGPVEGCLHSWVDRRSPSGAAPPRHAPTSSLRLLASPFFPKGNVVSYRLSGLRGLVVGSGPSRRSGHPLRVRFARPRPLALKRRGGGVGDPGFARRTT